MRRWPHLILCLTLGLGLLWPGTSAAQRDEGFETDNELLEEGLRLFDQVEYERAVEVLSAALLQQGNTTEDLIVIYRTLGTLYVYLGRLPEARAALTRLLCEAPDWTFSEYASPRIREVFDEVRAEWEAAGRPCETRTTPQAEPVAIDHESPELAEPGEPLELRLTIDDPSLRVASVAVHYRASGEQGFNDVLATMVSPGIYAATIPGDAVRAPAAEYFLVARDDAGTILDSLGTARAPMRVPVRSEGETGRTSVVRSWWFWTIIGAVVVGTALGLGLGLGLQDEPTPSDEHTISIRLCDSEDPGSCFN